MRSVTPPIFASLLVLAGACGGDDDGPGPGTGEDALYDDIYEGSCVAEPLCESFEIESACTCVTAPAVEADFATNRVGCAELPMEADAPRTPVDDYCDASASNGAPSIACMVEGMYRPAGTPMMVTLFGVVDVFGNGGDADGITVEVYEEGPDGSLGAMIGSSTASTASDCSETEIEYDNDMEVGERELGFYSIADVPTETPLVLRTSGMPEFWRDLYTYNFQVLNEDVEEGDAGEGCADMPAGPRHEYRGRILSRSDYTAIPLSAGLTSGIPLGSGGVAGEVHDCTNTRLEFAQVATSPSAEVLTYFNDNPSNPLPDRSRTEGTSLLGLYAALNIPEGPVDVAAVGRTADGEAVSLGWYRANVFPNAVSVVTFRGLRSQQTP